MPTPDEWRDTLVQRLDARWQKLRVYDAYYEGDQTLAYATQKFRDVYGGLFRELSDNWMQLVVDASVERLRVQGFRFGKNADADDDAWAIWQENGLDGESNMLHTESVKLSEAYWLVEPNGDVPRITAEHPSQVIVATHPGNRRVRLAAVKKWQEDDGSIRVNVYLPDRVVKYAAERMPSPIESGGTSLRSRWQTIGAERNPLGVVPVVPAPNNPSMIHGGRSDLAGGPIRIQDGINKLLADMLVGSEYTAFRQRVMLGVDQPRDSDGNPIPLDALDDAVSKSKFLFFPGKDAKAFEFGATDLDNFTKAIETLVQHLTAQTRTPPHYVAGKLVNVSGDALKAAETGLVAKVRDKMDPFGEAHEEAMRLAFRAIDPNDERAKAFDAETIWRDPESRSEAEKVDAATKKKTLDVPWEQLMEDIGYSPQQIDRMAAMRESDSLLADALGDNPQTGEFVGTPPAASSSASVPGLSMFSTGMREMERDRRLNGARQPA